MDLPDLEILKLQYEILNVSLTSIAKSCDMSPSILAKIAKEENWCRLWEDPDEPEINISLGQDLVEDELTVKSEQYINRTKKRLSVYVIAKNLLLAQRYTLLEASVIKKAHELLEAMELPDSKTLKNLADLYVSMTKESPMGFVLKENILEDLGGIPSLIIRDLSGTKKGDK